MQESTINKTAEDKYENDEILEEASEKLAAIIIAQIELNRNKDKNAYENKKRR